MQFSENMGNIAAALCQFQASVTNPPKTKTVQVKTKSGGTYSYTYADLGDIVDIIRPIMAEHKLFVSHNPIQTETKIGAAVMILHESGEWIKFDPILFDLPKGADPQAIGSLNTYARRYTLCSALGIAADDDDDANSVPTDKTTKQQTTQSKSNKPTTTTNKNETQAEQGPQKMISKAQLGKLASEGNNRGLNDDWQRAWCVTFYNVDSRTKLTASQASKMIEDFMKLTQDQLSEKIKKVKEHFEKIKGGVA